MNSNIFQQLINATFPLLGYQVHWLELIGILIGAASAYLGMKRWVWAWPVGIIANVMLFFVYLGAVFAADQRVPLFGQAGRQVFFIATSLYGWWRWNESRKRRGAQSTAPAITPRWATVSERLTLVGAWLLGTIVVKSVFDVIGLTWPAPDWFRWCDAWIFVGSFIATYSMARGWNEFWLAWIGVDLVGVPLGFATGYVPTAVMYSFYGVFVIYGFTQWAKATRTERGSIEPEPAQAPA